MNKKRNRIIYGIIILIVMLSGLASRRYSDILPGFIGEYAGDILWALLVFLLMGFIFSSWPTLKISAAALFFSFAIEGSQLYHAPWIDAIRRTTLGGLVLGFGFLWSDLICYSIGVGIGFVMDMIINKRRESHS